ncbi:hypothetical protein BH10PSE18_BH10PSE18_22930 [soil metagenome]
MSTPIRRVPRVEAPRPAHVMVPVPSSRTGRPAPRPIGAPPAPSQSDWEDAESREDVALQQAGGVSIPTNQHGGQDDQQQDKREESAASALSAAHAGGQRESSDDLPPALARLGGLVVAFAVHASAHGGWAAHVPLSADLLVATTLHLNCAHGVLTLRFETTDWDSRELLTRHAANLVQRLRSALPTLSSVELEA